VKHLTPVWALSGGHQNCLKIFQFHIRCAVYAPKSVATIVLPLIRRVQSSLPFLLPRRKLNFSKQGQKYFCISEKASMLRYHNHSGANGIDLI
jgi:hypothetical protein